MSKAYLMKLVVMGPAHQGFSNDVKFFDTEEAVKEAVAEQSRDLAELFKMGKILMATEKGPKVVMTVSDLLSMLGVSNVAATFSSGELHGKVIVAGRAPVIVMP